MNTPLKCPQCGSDAYVGNEYYFKCGNKGEGDFTTAVCLERRCELLSKRVKLLEEAGDELEDELVRLKKILADLGSRGTIGNAAMEKWKKAKGSK